MGTNEFQPRPAVEEPRTDHLENIDGVVEEISGNHGQLVLARPFLAGRIGGVDKKRHAEIKGRTVDRLELRIVQVDATHIRRDMTADETVFSDAANEFL